MGGADGAGATRGVVCDGGRARRASRRRGRLPLGGRGRPRARGSGAARPRLGRRRQRRGGAGACRRRHAGARRRVLARLRPRPRAARIRLDDGHGGVDRVFAALGDAGRRSLVEAVAVRGSATATELAAELPVTRQAVAKQLGALADAGLLRPTRDGRETRYEGTPEPLGDALDWIASVGGAWDARLDALQRSLAARRGRE